MASWETGYAKLNLALHVRRREADGYHAIETLFVFCEGGDELAFRDAPGLVIQGPFADGLEAGEDNLVVRAARGFAARFGGAEAGFRLDKRLPVAAGIGGGSADAAAALRLLCGQARIDQSDPAVKELAASLGADVPACLHSRPVRGVGRGDRLEAIAPVPPLPVLLVNPRVPLGTGPVFRAWDQVDRGALSEGEPLEVAVRGRNDLQAPAVALLPVIGEMMNLLSAQPGVRLARMSGSGATCFALFDGDADRDAAARAIGDAQPNWWQMATRLR